MPNEFAAQEYVERIIHELKEASGYDEPD